MAVDPKSEEAQALRKLFPLVTMPVRRYNTLCSQISIIEQPKGNFLFKQGDIPESFIYLLDGTVSLEAEEFRIEQITAGTDSAKFSLAHQFPRQISARAVTKVRYVNLQLNAFDKSIIDDVEEKGDYRVENESTSESEEPEDWMSALLKSPVFQRLPAMNLQQVLMSLEDIDVQKGETIFNQGDAGEYYYLIKRGRCSLTRKASAKAKEIKLLELRTNNTFGEDALLSGEPRSMTVTAITDMLLTRIDKERFIKLIKEPALSYVDYPTMLLECEQGKAIAIDIRSTDDFNKNHLKGSRNIPFFSLRLSLKELSLENQKVIIICDDGKVSEAAAFVLIKSKIDADILQGGMQGLPKELEGDSDTVLASDNSDVDAPIAVAEQDSHLVTNQEAEPAIEASTPDINTAADLEQENQILKAENKRLTIELEKIKKQYKLLYTQTGKLKNAFDKLQGSK